jgi:hypothetical protein
MATVHATEKLARDVRPPHEDGNRYLIHSYALYNRFHAAEYHE